MIVTPANNSLRVRGIEIKPLVSSLQGVYCCYFVISLYIVVATAWFQLKRPSDTDKKKRILNFVSLLTNVTTCMRFAFSLATLLPLGSSLTCNIVLKANMILQLAHFLFVFHLLCRRCNFLYDNIALKELKVPKGKLIGVIMTAVYSTTNSIFLLPFVVFSVQETTEDHLCITRLKFPGISEVKTDNKEVILLTLILCASVLSQLTLLVLVTYPVIRHVAAMKHMNSRTSSGNPMMSTVHRSAIVTGICVITDIICTLGAMRYRGDYTTTNAVFNVNILCNLIALNYILGNWRDRLFPWSFKRIEQNASSGNTENYTRSNV